MNINSEYGQVNVEDGKLNYTTTKLTDIIIFYSRRAM